MKNNNTIRESKKIALHFMQTLTDVAREPFLILDAKLRVISANPAFYQIFKVKLEQTENRFLYELGNGQWNIYELRRLLEEILPKNKIVRNYEVTHVFETIGEKTMLLNAKQIDAVQLVILAIEDVTERVRLQGKLVEYTKVLEMRVAKRTGELAGRVKELESLNKTMVGRELKMVELKKEIENLKKHTKNGNGKNGTWGNGNHKNGRKK